MTCVVVVVVVHPSENELCQRITKYCTNVRTDLLYNHTGHDVTNYFQSEVIERKTVEITASDGFGWNLSRMVLVRITIFYFLTSLAASGRLKNVIKRCTKVRKRVRPGK